MSHKKVVISESSSGEEEEKEVAPSIPPKKRQRKTKEELRGMHAMLDFSEKANEMLKAKGATGEFFLSTFCGQRVGKNKEGEIVFTKMNSPMPPIPSKEPGDKRNAALKPTKANEHQWQYGMELALKILTAYKVDHSKLTLLLDNDTLECFKKAAQGYINETRTAVTFNFTTQKTFQQMVGRLLLHFVLRASEIGLGTNPSGCAIWAHGCQTQLMCLHGSPMIQKEQLVEMDVSSENAQRVLKENPERAKITANRWGRNVVQMKNEDAYCCLMDVNMAGGNFSGNSCGMVFTDGSKALVAFRQIMDFQQACYPQMTSARSHLLMPLKCECNWNNPLPLLGRQTCKMTPFALSSAEQMDKEAVEDPKLLASLNNPALLVFQCCNPVYRSSKAASQKNCDFKISSVDLVVAMQIAKQIWSACIGTPPPLQFPEFKWGNEYRYQTTILPQGQHDDDTSLF